MKASVSKTEVPVTVSRVRISPCPPILPYKSNHYRLARNGFGFFFPKFVVENGKITGKNSSPGRPHDEATSARPEFVAGAALSHCPRRRPPQDQSVLRDACGSAGGFIDMTADRRMPPLAVGKENQGRSADRLHYRRADPSDRERPFDEAQRVCCPPSIYRFCRLGSGSYADPRGVRIHGRPH